MTAIPDLDAIGKQAVYWERLQVCEIEGFCNDVVSLITAYRAQQQQIAEIEAERDRLQEVIKALDAAGLKVLPKEATGTMLAKAIDWLNPEEAEQAYNEMAAAFDPATYEPEPTE